MAHIIKSYMSDALYSENHISINSENTDRVENNHEEDVLLSDIQDNDELANIQDENSALKTKINELETMISDLRNDFDNKITETVKQKINTRIDEYKTENDNIFKDKITNFENLMLKVIDEYRQYLFNSKSTLVDIVFASVYKLISTKYSSIEISNIVEESISEINDTNQVTVFISQSDYETLKKSPLGNGNIKFKIDERVKFGGCIIESDMESLDCRLDRKLDIFKNLMLGIYEDDA